MDAGDYHGQEEEEERTPFGAILEQRRLEKGLSLRDVEQATKIRTRYLEGLEREDYGALPDAVYVQGFLKTYANFLGLDGEQLSREFKDRRAPRRVRHLGNYEVPSGPGEFEQPLINPGGLSGAERRRISGSTILTIALAGLVLAAVIGGLYLIGSRSAGGPGEANGPEPQKETPAETEPAPSASGPASEPTTTTQPAGGGETTGALAANTVQATVRVPDTPSYLSIQTDGTSAYQQVAQPGFSQTFKASNAITVSTGNAGATQVEFNGQSLGALGSYGQVVTRTFTRDQPSGY
jgi:cytoskeleton protein RodZ